MKQLLKVTLAILFLYQGTTSASHVFGGEITYRYLDGLKYEITFKFYRDCRGVPVDSIRAEMRGRIGTTLITKKLSPTRVSIKDVSNYCKKNSNPCGNANTNGAGLGIEEHLFRDTVDFNKADSGFKKSCGIEFGFGQCCRYTSEDFWVTSYLNICTAPKNSSPVLSSLPRNILCCNQSVYYNNGAIDTLDNDSLSYRWTTPLVNWTNTSSCSGFVKDYWPPGYDKNKGANPNVNPPIGTYLDPETGDLIFTPTDCSDVACASIKITEWRKDSTGKYIVVGMVFRDLMYWVRTCPDNNPPSLNGPYKHDVCAGQKICFTITSDDKQFIPPAPAKPNPPDTVTLTWNQGIGKGATFKIIDTTARLQRGQFCWTPKESDASDLPYTFTITARDNNCPSNGITIKSYSIKVKKIAKTKITKTFIKNGLYELKSEVEKGFKGSPSYLWEIGDSIGNPIDTAFYFHPSNSLISTRQLDSIQFYKGGKYIIHHRINNAPLNCPTDYFDTIKVDPVTPILRVSPFGFQEKWACKNIADTIFPILKNAKNPVKYQWSSSSADTLPYLIIDNKQAATYRVDVHDGAGFHRTAVWNVSLIQGPILKNRNDISICTGDTVSISGTAQSYSDTVYWKWFYNGNLFSTDQEIRISNTGIYSLKISDTTNCFSNADTIIISNVILSSDKAMEKIVCVGDTVSLSDTNFNVSGTFYYRWFYGGKQIGTDSIISVVEPGKYTVEILDSNKCLTKRDTIVISNMIVKADAGPDLKYCQYDYIVFTVTGLDSTNNKTGSYAWFKEDFAGAPFSSKETFKIKYQDNGRLIVQLIQKKDSLICYDLDTVEYSFRSLPEVILGKGTICQNENELDLHTIIQKPVNSQKGIVSWQLTKTLRKPSGGENILNDLVYDKDNSANDLYYLKVDNSHIDLEGKFIDSVKLSLTYKDEFGCQNYSTKDATVIIRSNVEVTFINNEVKRCYGDSVKYISNDYGVNYYGGKWFTMNDSSNYLKWPQGNIVQLSEKLGTKSLDPDGGRYILKYVLENNQCLSFKNAILTIIPYPLIVWTQADRGDSIVLTDKTNAERREWHFNEKKITETNTLVVSKADAKQVKIELKVFNNSCETDSVIKPDVIIGINDLPKGGFSISPNPVRNGLLIKTSLNKAYSIEIINSLGQVLMVKSTNQSMETINVSGIPAGIYTIILKTGNGLLVQKFLKTSD